MADLFGSFRVAVKEARLAIDERRRGPVREWTQDEIVEAIREWAVVYGDGEPPTSIEWAPPVARYQGREDLARRFERDGCWPSVQVVRSLFGRWNIAIEEAGFIAVPQGVQRRTGVEGVYWTRDRIIGAIQWFVTEHGRVPISPDFTIATDSREPAEWREHGDPTGEFRPLPSFNAIVLVFGTLEEAIAAAGYETHRHGLGYWSPDKIVAAIRDLAASLGHRPTESDLHRARQDGQDVPGPSSVRDTFGSFGTALEAAGFEASEVRRGAAEGSYWTRERLIECIRAWVEVHGQVPRTTDWAHAGTIGKGRRGLSHPAAATVSRVFGSWAEALRVAGHPEAAARSERLAHPGQRKRTPQWTKRSIVNAMVGWHSEHGSLPTFGEWRLRDPDGTRPAAQTAARRMGSFEEARKQAQRAINRIDNARRAS